MHRAPWQGHGPHSLPIGRIVSLQLKAEPEVLSKFIRRYDPSSDDTRTNVASLIYVYVSLGIGVVIPLIPCGTLFPYKFRKYEY